MASVGRIEPYDCNCDLEAYLERLELYFIANNVGAISGDDSEAASGHKESGNAANAGRVRDIPVVEKFAESTTAVRIHVR